MKSLFSLMLLAFALSCGKESFSQESQSGKIDGLVETDYFDAFCIGSVAHVFWNTSLPDTRSAVEELSKIISVDRAAIHSAPDESNRSLINLMFGYETRFSEEAISAVNYGDSGYIWKIERSVFPAMGGSTGVPPRYLSYVNADGSLIFPSRYLFSKKKVGPETQLYSVLPFAELETSSSNVNRIDGEDALRLAKEGLDSLIKKADESDVAIMTRFHDQKLVAYPIKTAITGKSETCNVWQVRFLLADDVAFELFDDSPIVVWVTSSGRISRLSLDSWNAEIAGTKDCTEADTRRVRPRGIR